MGIGAAGRDSLTWRQASRPPQPPPAAAKARRRKPLCLPGRLPGQRRLGAQGGALQPGIA